MTGMIPAEVFPPGEFLGDELEARGWTQVEFAALIGKPVRLVNEVIQGKRTVTPETAVLLAAAIGTSAQFWMNLQTAYQLYELRKAGPAPDHIAREARLRELFPVREIVKRGWIKASEAPDVLEARLLRFYGLKSVNEERGFAHAARRTGGGELSPAQEAWLYRVKQIAEGMAVRPFSEQLLRGALEQLGALRSAPEEARHVPRILSECGVRCAIVEPGPGSKIDGVCFWLEGKNPAIGMSLRIDRIDNFWFVLRHEIEHVLRGDGKFAAIVDSGLYEVAEKGSDEHADEVAANKAAADFCIPEDRLDDFLARVGSNMAEERVVLFAQSLGVHPGLVVGQIQWRLQRFNFLRKYLVRIRDTVTPGAMTDGYGRHLLEAAE